MDSVAECANKNAAYHTQLSAINSLEIYFHELRHIFAQLTYIAR